MAFITDEQRNVLYELIQQYGVPDRTMLEITLEPYGVLWVRWHGDLSSFVEPFAGDPEDRNLFIKPDGTRLSWTLRT